MKKYDSYDIARYVMYYCDQKKKTNPKYEYNITKIQKILFAIYGTLLAKYDKSLINEQPRMWPYGPVFKKVFTKIKNKGFCPNSLEFDCKDVKGYVDTAIEFFGKHPAGVLSDWSHEPNSPWDKTKQRVGQEWNTKIKNSDIKSYFQSIMPNE